MSIFDQLFGGSGKTTMVAPQDALPGRQTPVLPAPRPHTVLGTSITGPWPEGTRVLYLAMGCFWGAEEIYWQVPGVISTEQAVNFAKALVRGEKDRWEILKTVVENKVREVI